MRKTCPQPCLKCYANVRGRENYKGHRGYRAYRVPYKQPWWEVLKKPSVVRVGGEPEFDRSQCEVCVDHPTLGEYLASGTWEDGTARKKSSLTLFIEGGQVKLCLSDKEFGRVAFVSAESVFIALEVLERGLVSDSLDWRASAQTAGGRRAK